METTKRTVIITGGNTGLGYSCAKTIGLADKSWHIVLACRNESKAKDAVQALKKECGHNNISCQKLDLSSLNSVRTFAANYSSHNLPPLKGLICNAGMAGDDKVNLTPDGIEITFQVNYLGHFLLVGLMLSQFISPAKILLVSSELHRNDGPMKSFRPKYISAKELAYPDITYSPRGIGNQRYSTTKLCLLLYMHQLAPIITKKGITLNAFNPGLMPDTGLGGLNKKPIRKYFLKYILPLFAKGAVSNPEKSGKVLAELLLTDNLEGITNKYFDRGQLIEPSNESFDATKMNDLWTTSLNLTGLNENIFTV